MRPRGERKAVRLGLGVHGDDELPNLSLRIADLESKLLKSEERVEELDR